MMNKPDDLLLSLIKLSDAQQAVENAQDDVAENIKLEAKRLGIIGTLNVYDWKIEDGILISSVYVTVKDCVTANDGYSVCEIYKNLLTGECEYSYVGTYDTQE